MKTMLVSVRYAVEVDIPDLHQYESDEAYACSTAGARVRDPEYDLYPIALEVVDWQER